MQDTVLLDRVLHTLAQDKHSKARALNHVHRVTQQTPLSMALATQQASMVQQLLLAGADPLVQCLHTRLVRPSPAAHGAASSSSDAWQAVPWRTTVLHMLLGESAGLVLGPVPWPEFLELQQLCLQVAEQLAKSEKHEAVLNTRVNEDGESAGAPGGRRGRMHAMWRLWLRSTTKARYFWVSSWSVQLGGAPKWYRPHPIPRPLGGCGCAPCRAHPSNKSSQCITTTAPGSPLPMCR